MDIAKVQRRAEQIAKERVFLGGPVQHFADRGLMQLDLLKHYGLRPHHTVLDVGAGALRAGIWIMDHLAPGNYYAIEPNRAMLEAGLRIAGPKLLQSAVPHFDHNDRFDFSVFGEAFDYGLARSIWTHASLSQIGTMLGSWAEVGGTLFASYLRTRMQPYRGDKWIGRSHNSDTPGMVRHRLYDIRKIASSNGLSVVKVKGWEVAGQSWLSIKGRGR